MESPPKTPPRQVPLRTQSPLPGEQQEKENPDAVVKSKHSASPEALAQKAKTIPNDRTYSPDKIEVDYDHANVFPTTNSKSLSLRRQNVIGSDEVTSTDNQQSIRGQNEKGSLNKWAEFCEKYSTEDLTDQNIKPRTTALAEPYADSQAQIVPDEISGIGERHSLEDSILSEIYDNVDCVYNVLQEKHTNIRTLLSAIANLVTIDSIYSNNMSSSYDEKTADIIKATFDALEPSAKKTVSSRLSSVDFRALVGLIQNHSVKTGANQEFPHDLVLKMKKLLIEFKSNAIAPGKKGNIKQPSPNDLKRVGAELNSYFHDFGGKFVRSAGKFGGDLLNANPDKNPISLNNLFDQRKGASGLSVDFEVELLNSKFVLEYPDGQKLWLTDFNKFGSADRREKIRHKQSCIYKLKEFCGQFQANQPLEPDENYIYTKYDLQPVHMIAYLANRGGMKIHDGIRHNMHSKNKLPLPRSAKTSGEIGGPIQTVTAESDDMYVIKAHNDGSFTVKLHCLSPITHCFSKNCDQITNMYPYFSHWNTITEVRLPADGTPPKLVNFIFDYAAVDSADKTTEKQVSEAVQFTARQSKEYWETKLAIPMYPEIPSGMSFDTAEAEQIARISSENFMSKNSDSFDELRGNITANNKCFSTEEIEKLLELVYELEISATIIRMAGSDLDAIAALSQLSRKYEKLLFILNRSAEMTGDWQNVPSTETEFADRHQIMHDRLTTCHAISLLTTKLLTRTQDTVYDFRAAADDHRISDDHEISKIENASLQTVAVVNTLIDIYVDCVEKEHEFKMNNPLKTPDNLSKDIKLILDMMVERASKINNNLDDVRTNRAKPMAFGTGIPDKKFKKSSGAIVTGLLREKHKQVPFEHPTYSQAQLASLRIKMLVRQKPYLKATLRDFDRKYARNYVAALEKQDWSPIVDNFIDVETKRGVPGIDGQPATVPFSEYKILRSTVTPAPSIQGEKNFTEKYGGRGMPSCNRIQAKHVNNLAHSQLSNRKDGKIMFAGLRHGFVDAYDIRPETMSSATMEEKLELLENVQNETLELNSFRNTRGIANIRASANEKIAKELVAAAVIADPVLLKNAKEGKPVRLSLDSVLLGSPDVTAFPRNSGKADHRLQANQRAALARLGDKVTIPMKFPVGNGYFEDRDVNVDLSVRSYTFPFSRHALSKNWLVKLFVKPFLGLRRADRLNEQPFRELLGPLDQELISGDVGKMANYLLKQTPPASPEPSAQIEPDHQKHILSETGQLIADRENLFIAEPEFDKDFADDIEARLQNMPFESRDDLAEAILTLARDTKRILREKMHHGTVEDPCILAARVSMLSYLLGRTPAYSCKNGMYRTGMLDTSIKILAADTAAKRVRYPEIPVDDRRNTIYSLCTGNLRLQELNNGRSGYNPKKFPWQLKNFRHTFARKMLVANSK